MDKKISQLEFHVQEGSNFASLLKKEQKEPEAQIERIKQVASTIYRIVYDRTEGLLKTLEEFKTDIKEVLVRVLEQQRNDFSMMGITIQTDIPPRDLLVFGEPISIAEILQNLVENVWKHSNGKVLKITITTEALPYIEGWEYVNVFIMDDGEGIGDCRKIDTIYGLKKVQSNTLSCCGELIIYWQEQNRYYRITELVQSSEVLETDKHYHFISRGFSDNFRTIAQVRLPCLAKKGK